MTESPIFEKLHPLNEFGDPYLLFHISTLALKIFEPSLKKMFDQNLHDRITLTLYSGRSGSGIVRGR